MKNFLPKSKSRQGFTLIELLIVISLIAVLAVMGFAAYRGFTSKANDSRRAADLKAVGDAMEANKSSTTGYYATLANSQFSSGTLPVDPTGGASGNSTHGPYILSYDVCNNSSTSFSVPAAWTNATLPTGSAFSGGTTPASCTQSSWAAVSTAVPTGNVLYWTICYVKDDNATVVCRNSAQ